MLDNIIVMMLLVILGGCSFTAGTVLQCLPFHEVWEHNGQGRCIDISAFWISNATWNIVTDLVLVVDDEAPAEPYANRQQISKL